MTSEEMLIEWGSCSLKKWKSAVSHGCCGMIFRKKIMSVFRKSGWFGVGLDPVEELQNLFY